MLTLIVLVGNGRTILTVWVLTWSVILWAMAIGVVLGWYNRVWNTGLGSSVVILLLMMMIVGGIPLCYYRFLRASGWACIRSVLNRIWARLMGLVFLLRAIG